MTMAKKTGRKLSQNRGSLSKTVPWRSITCDAGWHSSLPPFEQRVIWLTPVRTRLRRVSELAAIAQDIVDLKTTDDAVSVGLDPPFELALRVVDSVH